MTNAVQDARFDVIVDVAIDNSVDPGKWSSGPGNGTFNVLVCNRSATPVVGQGKTGGISFSVAKDICMPLTGVSDLQLLHGLVPWKAKVYIKWQ